MIARLTRIASVIACAVAPVLALAAGDRARPAIKRNIPDDPPSAMANSAIAEHNKKLDAVHSDFIKSRKLDVIGSLVKKTRVCRTNEQWAESWKKGNAYARDTVDTFMPKFRCYEGGC